MVQGAIIGLIVALAMMFIQRRNAKKGTGLAGQLQRTLADRGALTLREGAELIGQNTFIGRGQVARSRGALSSIGKVRIIPAPTAHRS